MSRTSQQKFTTSIVALGTGVALFVFLTTLTGALWGTPASAENFSINDPVKMEATTTDIISSSSITYDEPAKLLIPSINVNAKVQHVGLTANHAMGIPTNFTDVAWYKYGANPGNVGTAVIDGHVDNGLGLSGVFKHLSSLQTGDDINIIDKNGKQAHFIVTNIQEYPYNAAPTDEIFGSTGKPLLRLITCDGKWVKAAKTYDTRLVVTAELVP